LSRLLRVNNVHILDAALLPDIPIKPRLKLNLALALVLGIILGFGLVLLIEYSDRTVKTQEDLEKLGTIFLGIVPSINVSSKNYHNKSSENGANGKSKEERVSFEPDSLENINYDLFVNDYPKSNVSESCRAIRTNLLFMSASKSIKKILITSASPQEGKTTVATNLAIVMAQAGSRILLVDTDMRRPRLHQSFGIKPQRGISTMVLGESKLQDSVFHSKVENLDILMCGPTPPNPAELILTQSFAEIVDKLSEEYDHVIFDSPPVGVVTDAAILSKMVDGTVLIIKSMKTTKDAAKHAIGILNDIGSTILGTVLNDLDPFNKKYGKSYYYYYQNYGSYYQTDEIIDDASLDSMPPKSSSS